MAKKTGTAVTKWDEEFAKLATDAAKGFELPAAKFISCKSGVMTYGGAKMKDNMMDAIVVGAVLENQFYDPEVEYDPEVPQVPICFAFATEQDKSVMAPAEEANKPQADGCAECPHNEFGSAERGDGKACKNVLRIALIPYDLDDLSKVEVVYLKVPVMSVRNWSYYVNKVLKPLNRPYWSVGTRIALEPDEKSQFRLTFDLVEKVEDAAHFPVLKALWEKTMTGIAFPYIMTERKPREKKKPVGGKFARKGR